MQLGKSKKHIVGIGENALKEFELLKEHVQN